MKRFAEIFCGTIVASTLLTSLAVARVDHLVFMRGGDTASQVSCGATATEIAPRAGSIKPSSIIIGNNTSTIVYVGGSSVDATGGFTVCNSGCDFFNTMAIDTQKAWCRVSSGSQNVRVMWGE